MEVIELSLNVFFSVNNLSLIVYTLGCLINYWGFFSVNSHLYDLRHCLSQKMNCRLETVCIVMQWVSLSNENLIYGRLAFFEFQTLTGMYLRCCGDKKTFFIWFQFHKSDDVLFLSACLFPQQNTFSRA